MKKAFILLMSLSAFLMLSSCREKEDPVELSAISIDLEELEMAVGQTQQLSVLTIPENATAQNIEWESDRPNIASVSETGLVKAHPFNEGKTVITARCGDKEAHCNVTVKVPVKMLNFGQYQSKSMAVGEVWEWQVVYYPVNATDRNNVVYENSDPSVAELKQDKSNTAKFTLTAKKFGNTVITAKCGGKEAEVLVCVDAIKATKITVSPGSITLDPRETKLLIAVVEPSDATNKNVVWASTDNKVATVEYGLVRARRPGNAKIIVNSGDVYAECRVTVTDNIPEGAVDLGLSVFWASCNLGKNGFCSSPEEAGSYYAWGETSTKSNYDWKTYKFRESGNTFMDVTFSKYNTGSTWGDVVDHIKVLQRGENPGEKVDDVARAKLGGTWRMPTVEEFQELIENCNCTWMTLGGKTGQKITSRIDGFTDQWIFLPAAGYMDGKNLTSDYNNTPGKQGKYWSSSLYVRKPYGAWNLLLYDGGTSIATSARFAGLLVRPVCE